MGPQLTHVYEKIQGEDRDVDVFILEPAEASIQKTHQNLLVKKAPMEKHKGSGIIHICASRYYVHENDPVEQIVEELAMLDNVFALGVVNDYRESQGVIIRRELFDLVGRSYGKNFIEGKSAKNVMKYVKSFHPEASVFSVSKSVNEEMNDPLIHYFLVKDRYRRFCGVFSTKDMMLFYSRIVDNDMKQVQAIQRNIVGPSQKLQCNGSLVTGINQPAKEAGGDYYLIRQLDDDRLFYCVADVSGKGYPASLITAIIGTLLESTTFSSGLKGSLQKLNRFLQPKFGTLGVFATGLFVMYDQKTGESEICDCGHQYFYLLRDKKMSKIKSRANPPLGLMAELEMETYRIQSKPGDAMIIMTDGIAEQENETGEIYPLKRLGQLIYNTKQKELPETFLQDIHDFRGFAAQHDDITLLVHQRN